ncbi:MAG: Rps3 [Parcubacteria group bacterium GW2011_GWA2_33_14]|nr:MAG: Rps3 [Parcubacteria group bacterium GW2011_GWA2_33_14]
MTHKVNPKAFRIRGIEDFNIRGFYGKKMPQYLEEDFLIKDFLRNKLSEASVANIEIEHSANKLNIIIETARPALIIGRGGEGVEFLKGIIDKKIAQFNSEHELSVSQKEKNPATKQILADGKADASLIKDSPKGTIKRKGSAIKREIKIDIREVKNPWISAMLVGQWAALQIEKRIPFRQVLKRSMERVMQNKEVKGVKMGVSGRLNGTEIARKEWLKQGRMPLGTIRSDIDYAQVEAHCTYGTIGVKVWIYKGDKFE